MKRAENGSSVTVSYIGTLDNGRIFGSTDEGGPQTFILGSGELFPALERAIIGMQPGEVKNIVLAPEEAYGPRLPENIISLPRSSFPAGKEIAVGQKLSIEFKGGTSRTMIVTTVNESCVILDGNHPLVGQELTFALRLERVSFPRTTSRLDISAA